MSAERAIAGETARARSFAALHALEARGVPYCVWRGTRRLEKALDGGSDLDVLVDPRAERDAARALAEAGCRPSATGSSWSRPGLVDYFALGSPTGPLLHYHLHYRLVAGEPRLNRFTLPWDRGVLATRTRHPEHDVFVAAPHVEAALLVIRIALQLSWHERRPGGRARRLAAKVTGDLAHLVGSGPEEPTRELVGEWLGARAAATLPSPLVEIGLADLVRLRRAALPALRAYASTGGSAALVATELRALRAGLRKLVRRQTKRAWLLARGGTAGGTLVIVSGGSAEARSTLVARVAGVFRPKFDVLSYSNELARARAAASAGFLALCSLEEAPGVLCATSSELILDLGAAPDAAREPEGTWRGLGGSEDPLEDALEALWQRI